MSSDITELIEQQAARIKELEVERDIYATANRVSYDGMAAALEQLAALRSKIENAEVVAWMGEYNINDIRDHYTVVMRHKASFDGAPDRVRPLYTTPQLPQKEGWQWVPVEATDEMIDAAYSVDCQTDLPQTYAEVWQTMLAAAPKPAKEEK